MCSLQRNYDVIRNWERFETGPLAVSWLGDIVFLLKHCYNWFQELYQGLQINARSLKKILFLNQNISYVYSKEASQRDGSFEHPNTCLN